MDVDYSANAMNKEQLEQCRKYALVIPRSLEHLEKDNGLSIGCAIDLSIKDLSLEDPPTEIHNALILVLGKAFLTGRFEGFPDA